MFRILIETGVVEFVLSSKRQRPVDILVLAGYDAYFAERWCSGKKEVDVSLITNVPSGFVSLRNVTVP